MIFLRAVLMREVGLEPIAWKAKKSRGSCFSSTKSRKRIDPFISESQVGPADKGVRIAPAQALHAIFVELGIDLYRPIIEDVEVGLVPYRMIIWAPGRFP